MKTVNAQPFDEGNKEIIYLSPEESIDTPKPDTNDENVVGDSEDGDDSIKPLPEE